MLSNCTMHYVSVFEIYLENLYQSHFKTNQINKVQSIGKSGVRAHMTVTGPKLFVPFKMLLFSRYMFTEENKMFLNRFHRIYLKLSRTKSCQR